MSLIVRTAHAADIPRLIEIRAAVRENRLSDPRWAAAADYEPYVADGRCWVAEAHGSVVGFAALDSDRASVWALFVAPEAEGQGAGRMLLDTLLAEARRRGLGDLRLTTSEGTRAERVYRSAGWTEAGRKPDGSLIFRLTL